MPRADSKGQAVLIMSGNKDIQSMEDFCLPGLRMTGIEHRAPEKCEMCSFSLLESRRYSIVIGL